MFFIVVFQTESKEKQTLNATDDTVLLARDKDWRISPVEVVPINTNSSGGLQSNQSSHVIRTSRRETPLKSDREPLLSLTVLHAVLHSFRSLVSDHLTHQTLSLCSLCLCYATQSIRRIFSDYMELHVMRKRSKTLEKDPLWLEDDIS